MTTDSDLAHLLRSTGFAETEIEAIAAQARRGAELFPGDRLEAPPVGTSRFGGLPDLPEGTAWPHWERGIWQESPLGILERLGLRKRKSETVIKDCALDFLCQIDLAEAHAAGVCDPDLPADGLLSFFYDLEVTPFGEPEDAAGTKLMYFPGGTALARRDAPEAGVQPAPSICRAMAFLPKPTLPSGQEIDWRTVSPKTSSHPPLIAKYNKMIDGHHPPILERHGLGGWPHPVQGPVAREAASADAQRLPRDTPREILSQRMRQRDWQLVLQLSADDAMDWMFGDVGSVYVMMHKDDLTERAFDKAVVIMQCG